MQLILLRDVVLYLFEIVMSAIGLQRFKNNTQHFHMSTLEMHLIETCVLREQLRKCLVPSNS